MSAMPLYWLIAYSFDSRDFHFIYFIYFLYCLLEETQLSPKMAEPLERFKEVTNEQPSPGNESQSVPLGPSWWVFTFIEFLYMPLMLMLMPVKQKFATPSTSKLGGRYRWGKTSTYLVWASSELSNHTYRSHMFARLVEGSLMLSRHRVAISSRCRFQFISWTAHSGSR